MAKLFAVARLTRHLSLSMSQLVRSSTVAIKNKTYFAISRSAVNLRGEDYFFLIFSQGRVVVGFARPKT